MGCDALAWFDLWHLNLSLIKSPIGLLVLNGRHYLASRRFLERNCTVALVSRGRRSVKVLVLRVIQDRSILLNCSIQILLHFLLDLLRSGQRIWMW